MNEESQVFDADVFQLINCTSYSSQQYDKTWPRISIIDDPYHIPPSTLRKLQVRTTIQTVLYRTFDSGMCAHTALLQQNYNHATQHAL